MVRNGIGVALPASMESGKSTLTTGLVRAGFSYLTDEAVLLDWETGDVIPFPKPISLDTGSWALFPDLEPHGDLPDGYKRTQWQVAPTGIRPDAMGAPCRIRYFVFPKYTHGATTRLTPLARGEATVELAKNTFRFNERARRSLDALADAAPRGRVLPARRGRPRHRGRAGERARGGEAVSEPPCNSDDASRRAGPERPGPQGRERE